MRIKPYEPVVVARIVRKPVNLSIDAEMLREARLLDLNLSATLEAALLDRLRQRRRDQWLAENRGAIDAYNEQLAQHGAFGDTLRSF